MAKERIHDMKQTTSSFQCRGVISRTESQQFYKDKIGSNKDGISVNFGVKINDNKEVFVTLTGYPRKEVYYYKRGENSAKGTSKAVAWKDRTKSPGEGYNLIGTKITTGKDEDGNNINTIFTEYDAVNYLKKNLQDGDSVFIKGKIEFRSWTGKNGELKKAINLVPNQISYMKKPIDFEADDYEEMCEFENTIVFQSIDKEEDENGKTTGRFILSGWSIGYNTVENVSFILKEDCAKLAGNLKKAMKTGYSIKTFGRVEVINDIGVVQEGDQEGWGTTSPMERVNSSTRREYIVYRADPNSIEKEDYSENEISEAIRKIKAAKTAKENFGEKADTNTDSDDWGSDDSFDDDSSWD
jgi:hypothetical protein